MFKVCFGHKKTNLGIYTLVGFGFFNCLFENDVGGDAIGDFN